MRRFSWMVPALLAAWSLPAAAQLHYTVDLDDPATHTATITLRVDDLTAADSVFQFAATAPGTYQTMNIGRFVRGLRATDARGRAVPVRQTSVNTWVFGDPARVRQVTYQVQDTWNTPAGDLPIYPMAGTAIEADHALLNTHAMLGFPRRMQARPLTIRFHHPPGWTVETPLVEGPEGYEARSYDHAVDSPFLLGARITTSTLTVGGVPIRIAAYSPTQGVTADELRESMRGTLEAAGQFLGRLPVDRYVFLFRYAPPREGQAMGAWEHSYSSEYVLPDAPFSPEVGEGAVDISAHEFFHVVTPLNIHSEIIEHFNFQTPVPSRHLWLYEGVTEWASEKMQLDGGLITLDAYLGRVVGKMRVDRARFDTTVSLRQLAMTSFTPAGARQYGNIYQRGAVTAGLLDIRLLQLSNGEHGLRDLMLELAREYGPSRPFPEDSLYDIIARRTSPQVLDFFARYVDGAEHPPLREYYALLGFTLEEDARGLPVRLVPDPNATPEQLRLRQAWLRSGSGASPAP
ncbi:MAG TPA: hypothetical protein VFT45_11410 [Longimicrobium sp.]|nr:hypothetical protein [Longimicrobium sp.]